MSDADPTLAVPLVPGMIHRPEAPRHMMRIKPAERRVRVRLGQRTLAESTRALRLIEIGRDVADPVLYLPLEDVVATLAESGRSTHCPLKGDTTYFDLADGTADAIGWSYTRPLPFAAELAGHIAFDAARVTFESAPPGEDAPSGDA